MTDARKRLTLSVSVAIVFIGLLFIISSLLPVTPEDMVSTKDVSAESAVVWNTAYKYGSEGRWSNWKSSGEEMRISIPYEWELQEGAAGGVQTIVAFDPNTPDEQFVIELWDSVLIDGTFVTYDDWVNDYFALLTKSGEKCGTMRFGGMELACYKDPSKETLLHLFGKFDRHDYIHVSYLNGPWSTYKQVVGSTILKPTDSDLIHSRFIPRAQ